MTTNLFPAILLAGPPNCGKSVLSYLLTMKLREAGIDHYLVRTAPDGEGDWYLTGDFARVHPLRMGHKKKFTEKLVNHMIDRIRNRPLPLLVDIGGDPRDHQWDILRACTHSVLLYQEEQDLLKWRGELAALELLPIAELCSDLSQADQIRRTHPVLEGRISGLDRKVPGASMTFGALLDRVAGICQYERGFLEKQHFRQAPGPILDERQLGTTLGVTFRGGWPWWEPTDLPGVMGLVPAGETGAIYGRGPVWLAAALATQMLPAPSWIFDTNLGWTHIPDIVPGDPSDLKVQTRKSPDEETVWIEIGLSELLDEPQKTFPFPEVEEKLGVILSGKLPRWLFAALARKLAIERPWIAIHVPAHDNAVIIFSLVKERQVGDTIAIEHEPIPSQ